ncbi:hypothetical protein, partial [Xanthomonas translucens]|uniref:hypothetical protein n=1 Tax=Xanthomonas campestris pv. translucens TaxID=343 RepID=UPI002109E5AC
MTRRTWRPRLALLSRDTRRLLRLGFGGFGGGRIVVEIELRLAAARRWCGFAVAFAIACIQVVVVERCTLAAAAGFAIAATTATAATTTATA